MNPEVYAVIRYLTKAFQYELKVTGEDLEQIKKIIKAFDPKSAATGPVNSWIEKNAKKLIQNAVNIEYAAKVLEELGLKEKLIAIKKDVNTVDSLAWWLSRKPLPSFELGQGKGQTARELKLDIVAHETNNFLSYESITRAHTGEPNVLTSRQGAEGEAAAHGEGFYTRVGREGARATGFTIRFRLNPEAKEGKDFIRAGADYVVVLNKRALTVIPESLKVDPVYYFELLAGKREEIAHSDTALLEKLKRRVQTEMGLLSSEEEEKIVALVRENPQNKRLLEQWFSLGISKKYPELLERVDSSLLSEVLGEHAADWLVAMRERKMLRERLMALYPETAHALIERILDAPDIAGARPVLAKKAIEAAESSLLSQDVREAPQLLKLLEGTSLESSVEEALAAGCMKNIHGSAAMGRALTTAIHSPDSSLRRFGSQLLAQALPKDARHFKILEAYREILAIKKVSCLFSFEEATIHWLGRQGVEPALKAEYLFTQLGQGADATGKSRFEILLEHVPKSEHAAIWDEMEKHTAIHVFRKLASEKKVQGGGFLGLFKKPVEKSNAERLLYTHGKPESFEFRPIITEEERKSGGVTFTMGEGSEAHQVTLTKPFEMQATPFTQLEALLSTGGNQSQNVENGIEVEVNGKKIKLKPNHPAERYSWEDEEKIIEALNQNDPKWHYRRPTEAEWEYAARGGTKTTFSFGDGEKNVNSYAWTSNNSNNETHPVGELRTNGFGLYDMHGNVWEWVQDWYGDYPTGSVKNPTGPSSGSHRVVRGGGAWYDPQGSRSAGRKYVLPGDRYDGVGLRLVRTPR